jgi:hypothetical protein
LPHRTANSRPLTLACAALAGALFSLILVWLLGVFGWIEAGLAQAAHPTVGGVHTYYGLVVPVLDASLSGLLVGLVLGLIRLDSRWLHIAVFFVAFYGAEILIYGPRVFTQLFVASPFMWLFPMATCAVVLLASRLRRGAIGRA